MFFGKLHEVKIDGVETIGGKEFKPTGIGTVKWSWKDDEGESHTCKLERVPYCSYNVGGYTYLLQSVAIHFNHTVYIICWFISKFSRGGEFEFFQWGKKIKYL